MMEGHVQGKVLAARAEEIAVGETSKYAVRRSNACRDRLVGTYISLY